MQNAYADKVRLVLTVPLLQLGPLRRLAIAIVSSNANLKSHLAQSKLLPYAVCNCCSRAILTVI